MSDGPRSSDIAGPAISVEREVAERIEAGTIGAVHIRVLILCMLIAAVDGYDTASMGLATPLIAHAWNLSPGVFGVPLAAVLVGSAAGGIFLGWLGDKLGRKPMVIASAIGVALTSIGASSASNVTEMIIWRFLIGLAFGVGIPNFYALIGDIIPSRHRSFCTTLLAASIAIGGILAGLAAPALSARFGWQGIFVFGGLTPLMLAFLMIFFLRESPRVLAARGRFRKLAAVLADYGLDNRNLPETHDDAKVGRGGPIALVRDGLLLLTLFYALGYISCAFAYHILSDWLPSLLTHSGWPSSSAQRSITFLYGGSMVGGLALSWLMDRLSRRGLLVPGTAFALGSMLFLAVGYWLTSDFVFPLLAGLGLAVGGGQYVLPAVTVRLYPPRLRATALSWFSPLSRIGGISGSLAGGWLLLSGLSASHIMMVMSLSPALCALVFAMLFTITARARPAGNEGSRAPIG